MIIYLDLMLPKHTKCGNLDPREVKVAQRDLTQEFPQGIPECGTDALRFTLSSYLQQGRQINMDLQRVVSYRHFCNKIWNAYRFMLPHLPPRGDSSCPTILRSELEQHPSLGLAEHWILSRLDKTVSEINAGLHDFQLASSTTALYSFFVHDFCDVYVELSKARLSAGANSEDQVATVNVLEYCFDTTLRLLHPFMPFISEELWQRLYAVGLRHSIQDMEYPAVERIDQLDATTIHKSMEVRSTSVSLLSFLLRHMYDSIPASTGDCPSISIVESHAQDVMSTKSSPEYVCGSDHLLHR